jgi:hypothetical protein
LSPSQQRVPRGLHGLDLFEKKFKPIELTVDERFKMLREGAAVAGLEFFLPLAPVAAQRLIPSHCRPVQSDKRVNVAHGWA